MASGPNLEQFTIVREHVALAGGWVNLAGGDAGGAWLYPDWSPDGLYAIRPSGGGLRTITLGLPDMVQAIAWSRDGTRLAVSTYGDELYVVNAGGSNLVKVAGDIEPIFTPDWRNALNAPPQWAPWP